MYFPVLGLLMVKNERKNIKRTLKSFHFIDRWLITDTGSTDGTIAKIKAVLTKMNKKFDIVKVPWVNYAFNRNMLLDGAKQLKLAYKYSLMIDSADTCRNFDSLEKLIYKDFEIGYIPVETDNKLTPIVYQPRLLKVDTELLYRYAIHETIRPYHTTILNQDLEKEDEPFTIIHNYKEDKTRHRSLESDVEFLISDLKNPTNDKGDIRNRLENLTYTLLSLGKKEEAMNYFKQLVRDHYAEEEVEVKTRQWDQISEKISKINNIENAPPNNNGSE